MRLHHTGQPIVSALQLRWAFRVLATLGAGQGLLGIYLFVFATSDTPWFMVLTIGTFLTSSLLLLWKQPQFSCIFGLTSSAYAFNRIVAEGFYVPAIWWLFVPTLWLFLFHHPMKLPSGGWQIVARLGFAMSLACTLPIVFELPIDNFKFAETASVLAVGAVVLISHRCFSEGLLRSPRTMVFAISLAPVLLLLVVGGLLPSLSLDRPGIFVTVNSFLLLAPTGCLIMELAQLKTLRTTSHAGEKTA